MMLKFARILPLPLIGLLLLACAGREAVGLRYQAEKMYFLANRAMSLAQEQQGVVSNETLRKIAGQYRDLAQFCYQAVRSIDSTAHPVEHEELRFYAVQGATQVAQIYYAVGRFDTSIIILNDLIHQVNLNTAQQAGTYVNLGEALQAEGRWDSAFTIYGKALQLKPLPIDDSANVLMPLFNLPTHMFAISRVIGDQAQVNRQFKATEQYYLSLVAERAHPKLVEMSHSALARLYDNVGDWENVITQLAQVHDTSLERTVSAKVGIADIYDTRLNQPERALMIYDDLLRNAIPDTDTLLRPYVQYKTATVRLDQKKYQQARSILLDIEKTNERYFDRFAPAQLAVARSFELENNWDRAVTEYRALIENYRGSEESMQAYLHVAATYESMQRVPEAESWYHEAEEYLDDMAGRHKGEYGEAQALYFKSQLFQQRKRWSQAAQTLLDLFAAFPDTDTGRKAIVEAGSIYRDQLHDQVKSDSLFAVFRGALTKIRPGWEVMDQDSIGRVQ